MEKALVFISFSQALNFSICYNDTKISKEVRQNELGSISAGRNAPLDGGVREKITTAVEGRKVATELRLERMKWDSMETRTYRLDEPPVLEECGLILDIITRHPCLDLISEPL